MNYIESIGRLDRRYQVFVSSPYIGLEDERRAAINAILDADCIPVGMEMFPPTNEDQFSFIKKVIDQSDFYLVLLGDSYGTIHESEGISYTEMEFDYALKTKTPIIALVSKNYGRYVKNFSKDVAKKYRSFRVKLRKNRIAPEFETKDQLKYEISKGLRELRKEASLAMGYVKSDDVVEIIRDIDDSDTDSRNRYLEAIESLSEINIDEELWEHVHNIFHNIRDATHSLLYDPAPKTKVQKGEHASYLKNVINSLKIFIEGVLNVRIRVSVKILTIEQNMAPTVSTLSSTSGRDFSKAKEYELSRYAGLQLLYESNETDEICTYRAQDIRQEIKSGTFGPGRFTSVDDYFNIKRMPYISTLCTPIRKIDTIGDQQFVVCRGFLCVDSPMENAFIHDSVSSMVCAVSDILYLFLTVKDLQRENPQMVSMLRKHLMNKRENSKGMMGTDL
ncbi:MAG: DUF4062 domain-containing protein [Bacteroidales bacterium]|jgi:hypothetical protein|nr:DUF4062 domain-containing protein [Bacteroidales bacterium]